ncbi:OB-fold domain-containing protein [Streptomyces sp. 11x1]|uniref:Zn-ribbon domain-containing OB-fold protein n=1 Tax=Streptomyces sp. 11x1 TaxID=3038642 RepID=UPI00293001A4|nr:OB-fold domain-containing protein [Streptomyces sp. 11x1]WNZ10714.1 OB-fold domain-containing protein [Streptomyces sp. 11x1]
MVRGGEGVRFDQPEADGLSRTYWDAAADGRLLLRRCGATGCGRAHHYPREFCPYCWSEDVRWEEASGRAVLYTWSVVHRNDLPPFGERTPYVPAVVDLVEGPRMMTEVVEEPGEKVGEKTGEKAGGLRVGMELEVVFREAGEFVVPVFRARS